MYTPTKPESRVITKKDGVNEFALYIEAVSYHATTGRFSEHLKFVVSGRGHVFLYVREHGKKAATWRKAKRDSLESALQFVNTRLKKHSDSQFRTLELRGSPLLIELRPADLEALDTNTPIPSRYVGASEMDRALGKVTDESSIEVPKAETTPPGFFTPATAPAATPSTTTAPF
jgi:hypothetical protein